LTVGPDTAPGADWRWPRLFSCGDSKQDYADELINRLRMGHAQGRKNIGVTQPGVRSVRHLHYQHGLNVPEPA
jgi:hypothetical protein